MKEKSIPIAIAVATGIMAFWKVKSFIKWWREDIQERRKKIEEKKNRIDWL
jgi:hypothetical protein